MLDRAVVKCDVQSVALGLKRCGLAGDPPDLAPVPAVNARVNRPVPADQDQLSRHAPHNQPRHGGALLPALATIARSVDRRLTRRYEPIRVVRIHRQGDQRLRHGSLLPCLAGIRADQELRRAGLPIRPETIDPRSVGFEDVEVRLAAQRYRLPRLTSVARLDQAEERRQVVATVRMTRAQEAIGGDNGEAHRVLIAIADA